MSVVSTVIVDHPITISRFFTVEQVQVYIPEESVSNLSALLGLVVAPISWYRKVKWLELRHAGLQVGGTPRRDIHLGVTRIGKVVSP